MEALQEKGYLPPAPRGCCRDSMWLRRGVVQATRWPGTRDHLGIRHSANQSRQQDPAPTALPGGQSRDPGTGDAWRRYAFQKTCVMRSKSQCSLPWGAAIRPPALLHRKLVTKLSCPRKESCLKQLVLKPAPQASEGGARDLENQALCLTKLSNQRFHSEQPSPLPGTQLGSGSQARCCTQRGRGALQEAVLPW